MQKQIEGVTRFHQAFRVGFSKYPVADLDPAQKKLRYALMQEENQEYLQAANKNDLVGIADALGDMLYILCGTIITHGLQDKIEAIFEEIQRSNMSKLNTNGEPIYREDGKVLKGPNYSKPDFSKII
ncbi:nucleoside triphosphate pyrophosphohydrolase family protein [Flavobacterium crassostreae]|uniref:Phosphoribosyl-ATP pyrophosphohydrolase n=1 Tax=Flavobacterium crassostreae TaxID=1763534 RepID=A0A1B9E0M9_9FLAO|nr:nucleoside triphosphate pyrophosphohydrolase family protein [Flavobacterium crassostreae]OCB75500.1 hypothetical protein LPBF_07815 [Flavobacterium crassostreae]